MLQIKVNGKYDFEFENSTAATGNETISADVKQLSDTTWHIIDQLLSYNAEVISLNREEKIAEIKVNNNTYTVTAKDQFDVLLDKLGLSSQNNAKVSEAKAPMPGLVLKVFAKEGSEVKKGENLFILEAMKMENIIKAPADVTVKTVKIKPGDKVEKNQVLLLFK